MIAPQNNGYTQESNQDMPMEQAISIAPKEPEAFEFSATMPSMSAQDLYSTHIY